MHTRARHAEEMTNENSRSEMADLPAGWYIDPSGQGDARYWNGTSWTATVSRGGQTLNVVIDPAHAGVPPIAGTEVHLPTPVSTTATPDRHAKRSPALAILGVLAVILTVVAIFVLLSDDNSPNDSPPEPTTPATAAPTPTAAPSEGG